MTGHDGPGYLRQPLPAPSTNQQQVLARQCSAFSRPKTGTQVRRPLAVGIAERPITTDYLQRTRRGGTKDRGLSEINGQVTQHLERFFRCNMASDIAFRTPLGVMPGASQNAAFTAMPDRQFGRQVFGMLCHLANKRSRKKPAAARQS